MTEVQLLNKTEVWINGISLKDANLPDLANAAATALNIPQEKVFVTDVRENLVVFDILVPRLNLEDITGKEAMLLDALRRISGVTLAPNAKVHSEGILGVIGTDRAQAVTYLEGAKKLNKQLSDYAAKRLCVISTGSEMQSGNVEDTNFLVIKSAMADAGYEVEFGGIAGDSEREIAGLIARQSGEGYGVIITTGGVGAEDKDKTIEALEMLDKDLTTAILAQYKIGHGRHVKAHVRIGVAKLGWSIIISLPGPTHEVKLAMPIIINHLKENDDHSQLAEKIAIPLRATLPKHSH